MGFGSAVIKKDNKSVLHHVSASQIGTHEDCPLRWYMDKVEGVPSFSDWTWADSGVAAHEILEDRVGLVIGIEPDLTKKRIVDPAVIEEAEELLSSFVWEDYFEGHQIIDVEMDIVLNLNNLDIDEGEEKDDFIYPLFVGSADVVSMDEDMVVVITDWKTGYGAQKGVDIQAQFYALGLMQNMGVENIIFRRIYPRLSGEIKGTKKVEEYMFNMQDAKRYIQRIKHIARKMSRTVSGEITPKITPSVSCVHCPVAYNCPKVKEAAFTPQALADKRKVLKAALGQVDGALKKIADKGDFYVGDEFYGYNMSAFYRSSEIKSGEVASAISKKNMKLLIEKAKVTIDEDVKKELIKEGFGGFKITVKKTFAWKNEKELKEAAKAAKKKEKTIADSLEKAAKKEEKRIGGNLIEVA